MTKGCPCLHTTPCHPRCTCVMPASSSGCRRCCSYGSKEQQKKMAEHLAKKFSWDELKFPPVQLQDGSSPEWACSACGGDALFCGCAAEGVNDEVQRLRAMISGLMIEIRVLKAKISGGR